MAAAMNNSMNGGQRSNSNMKKPPGYRRNLEKAIEELQEKLTGLEGERKQVFLQA
jgi:chromosome segregation ATPase